MIQGFGDTAAQCRQNEPFGSRRVHFSRDARRVCPADERVGDHGVARVEVATQIASAQRRVKRSSAGRLRPARTASRFGPAKALVLPE